MANASSLFLIAGGLLLVASGGYVTAREIQAFVSYGETPAQHVSAFVPAPPPIPLSSDGQVSIAQDCQATSWALDTLLRTVEERQSVVRSCYALDTEITTHSPTNGFVWAMAAYAAGESGQSENFKAALQQSFQVSPFEQWIAEYRVDLSERYSTLMSPALFDLERKDLAMLAQSKKGIRSIAERYANSPDFREKVVEVVSGLPDSDQRRFLAEVKKAVSELGYPQQP